MHSDIELLPFGDRGASPQDIEEYARACVAADRQRHCREAGTLLALIPSTAAEIRQFIDSDFNSLTYGQDDHEPSDDDIYSVRADDLLSSFLVLLEQVNFSLSPASRDTYTESLANPPEDWPFWCTEGAGKVLTLLSVSQDASQEPGCDRVRDRLAQAIYQSFSGASDHKITADMAAHFGAKGSPHSEEERLLFEAYMKAHCWRVGEWDDKGFYSELLTRMLFGVWRDHAAMARRIR